MVAAVFALTLLISSVAYSQYFWELKQSGSSTGGPIDVEKYNANNVYYGSRDTIYKSTDRGETFSLLASVPNSFSINNIILNDNNPSEFLVAIKNNDNAFNRILKTTDAGDTWNIVADSLSFSHFGIPMTPDPTHPDTVYTMNDTIFMRSTNFGDTWDLLSDSVGCSTPCDIEVFPDTSIILIGDDGTGIFKSTDYGKTWSQVHNTTGEIPTIAVDYQTPGVAWAARWGGGGGVLRSTDYGSTWILDNFFSGQNMWSVHVHPDNSDYVSAGRFSGGLMYITHDGGNSWVSAATGSSNYQVYIVDTMTVFAAQGNGLWKLNSDYFIPVELTSFTASVIDTKVILNWLTATEINNHGFEVERSFDRDNFFTIGFVSGSGTTTDQRVYSYTDQPNHTNIYYRLKQVDFDGSFEYSNVLEVNILTPSYFYLAQNHPNPFNPETIISFSIPEEGYLTLEVFNVLGELVEILFDELASSGKYSVTLNASSLPSGVYFYKLDFAGKGSSNFSEVKKMVIAK